MKRSSDVNADKIVIDNETDESKTAVIKSNIPSASTIMTLSELG